MGNVVHLKLELAKILFQIDKAVTPEINIGLACFYINGNKLLTYSREENTLDLSIGPVLDTAGLDRRKQRWSCQVTLGIEHP